jgi:hypothetical protein
VAKKPKKKAKSNLNKFYLAGAAVIMAGVIWFSLSAPGNGTVQTAEAEVPSTETLPPALFTGATREAYQIAREIPLVLDKLPCFCGCATSFGHNSNLHCFKDDHGAVCDMCRDIALLAGQMTRAGRSVPEIREAMRQRYRM